MKKEELISKLANYKYLPHFIIVSSIVLTIITLNYLFWIFSEWDNFHHCCCDDTTYFKDTNKEYNVHGLSIMHKIWTAEQDCCTVCSKYNWTNAVCEASDRMKLNPMYSNASNQVIG